MSLILSKEDICNEFEGSQLIIDVPNVKLFIDFVKSFLIKVSLYYITWIPAATTK